MSDLKSLYLFLKSKGLVKNLKPEYESTPLPSPIPAISPEVIRPISPKGENAQEPENPAQTDEVKNHNRQEYISWKSGLSEKDLSDYNFIFNE